MWLTHSRSPFSMYGTESFEMCLPFCIVCRRFVVVRCSSSSSSWFIQSMYYAYGKSCYGFVGFIGFAIIKSVSIYACILHSVYVKREKTHINHCTPFTCTHSHSYVSVYPSIYLSILNVCAWLCGFQVCTYQIDCDAV